MAKLLHTFLLILALVIGSSVCQRYRPSDSVCKKYCFKDCSKYRNSNVILIFSIKEAPSAGDDNEEFNYTDCVTANYTCGCDVRFSLKNPLMMMGMITIMILLIAIVYRMYSKCKKRDNDAWRSSPNVTSSCPVVPYGTNTISHANYAATNFGYQSSSTLPEAPPDYLPPPAYHEIVNNNTEIKASR